MGTPPRKRGHLGEPSVDQPIDILGIEWLAIISDQKGWRFFTDKPLTGGTVCIYLGLHLPTEGYKTLFIPLAQHLKLHGSGIDIGIEQSYQLGPPHSRHIEYGEYEMIAQSGEIVVRHLFIEKKIHLGRPDKRRKRFMYLGRYYIAHKRLGYNALLLQITIKSAQGRELAGYRTRRDALFHKRSRPVAHVVSLGHLGGNATFELREIILELRQVMLI